MVSDINYSEKYVLSSQFFTFLEAENVKKDEIEDMRFHPSGKTRKYM